MQAQKIQPQQPIIHPESLVIKKQGDQKLDLTTDPNSPWHKALPEVKDLFNRTANRQITLTDIVHPFQKKRGKSNICTEFFPSGGEYYTCQDCCKNGGGYIMCFCESCWEPEKHEGHNYDKRTAWSTGAYCDCGWDDRITPESFCKNHGQKDIIQIDIPKEQKQKFMNFFEPLIHVGLYLSQNSHNNNLEQKLWTNLSKVLIKLLESGLFYIRIFMQILEKEILFNDRTITVLQALLTSNIDHEHLLFRVAGDKQSKIKLAKVLTRLLNQGKWDSSSNYSTLVKDCFTERGILMELAENGIFINKYESKYVELMEKQGEKGEDILYKYHLHQRQMKSQGQFISFLIQFWSQKAEKLLIKKKQFLTLVFENIFKSFEDPADSINTNEYDNSSTINRNVLISQLIFSFCHTNVQEVINFQTNLQALNINKDLFQAFMQSSMKTAKKMSYKCDTPKDSRLIPILLLLIKNEKQQELVHQLWKSLTRQNDSLREDFIQTIDVLYHLIALINNFESYVLELRGANKQQSQNDIESKQKWFRSFLYENHSISKDELQGMRKSKKLYFKNASKILRELCKYKESQDCFEYVSDKKYPNFQLKYKVRPRSERGNFRSLPKTYFSIEDEIEVPGDRREMELFTIMFKHPSFMETYKNIWWEKVQKNEKDENRVNFWKNYQLGYYYMLILVSAKHLMNGTNPKLEEQISRVRNDQELFDKINSFNSSTTLLKRLLPKTQQPQQFKSPEKKSEQQQEEEIVESPEKQQSPEKQEQEQLQAPDLEKKTSLAVRKQKFNKKKLAKYEKLKEKRKMVLTKNVSESSQTHEEKLSEQNQDQCLLCHERGKSNNAMVYLGFLEKDSTLSASFHGKEDKSDLLFNSCFHTLHTKCYLNIDKRDMEFSCPLCSKKANMIFPCLSKREQSIRICQNVLNAVYIVKFKELSFNSLQELLFKHLVESYGLNSLIYIPRYHLQKKKTKRLNQYILSLMESIYANTKYGDANPQFQKIFQTFNQSLLNCSNPLIRDVQLFISKMIHSKITTGLADYDDDLLQSIRNQLIPEQFQVLIQSLEHLTEEEIAISDRIKDNEKTQEMKQYKKLSFSVINIPMNTESLNTWMDKPCCGCQKKRDIVCLISGKCFCKDQSCNGIKEHKQQYKDNLLVLKISSGRVNSFKKRGGRRTEDIYFDAFMMPYNQKQCAHPQDGFELNALKFEKVTKAFFEIQ